MRSWRERVRVVLGVLWSKGASMVGLRRYGDGFI